MANAGVNVGVVAARPSFAIDGTVKPELGDDLLSLRVEETTDGLYACEASFINWGVIGGGSVGFLHFERGTFDFGTLLRVDATGGGDVETLFEGRITAIESQVPGAQPPSIVVRAEDRLQDLRMTRRTRVFEEVTDRDIAQQIAREHSLRPDLDLDGPRYRAVAQVNQSDLAFLRDRARSIDAEVWTRGDTLHVQARARRDAGDLALTFGEGLRTFTGRADLAHQQTAFTVGGWDVQSKEGIEETATESAIRGELNGGRSGAAALNNTLGERTQTLVHTVPLTTDEARAVAEASFRQHARRFVEADGVAEGDVRLRVGARLDLDGVGPPFSGNGYVLTRALHTFDGVDGYRTHFTAQRPFVNR